MKQNLSIPIILTLVFIVFGLLNIFLWHNNIVSIYGLVFGVVSLILAWFVFHFRHKK